MGRPGALLLGLALLGGCATAARQASPPLDISGCWSGTWSGFGIVNIPREALIMARFTQRGDSGWGWIRVEDSPASESVPLALVRAGAAGAPLILEVRPDSVIARHELGGRITSTEFRMVNDRLVGRMIGTDLPMRLRLARESCPGATTAQIELPPRTAALETAPAPAPAAAPTPVAPPAPVRAAPAPSTFTASAAVKPIYFDFDRDVIRPADARTLDANAQWLKANPATLLLVEGHCDERGTNEYNIALGERRARAAMKYLVEAGVAADRISLISYGEERPVCAEHTEACWALNRRAVFLVKPR